MPASTISWPSSGRHCNGSRTTLLAITRPDISRRPSPTGTTWMPRRPWYSVVTTEVDRRDRVGDGLPPGRSARSRRRAPRSAGQHAVVGPAPHHGRAGGPPAPQAVPRRRRPRPDLPGRLLSAVRVLVSGSTPLALRRLAMDRRRGGDRNVGRLVD